MVPVITFAAATLLLLIPSRILAGVFYEDGATTMHFAFEGNPNGDRPVVRPPAFYHADDGFGFVDSPTLIGTANGVTAPKYFRFDVNLPDGNYDVSITFGGTRDESVTTVKAQGHRPMLLDIRVAPRQTVTRTFTVNVHGGGVKPSDSTGPLDADGRLHLEFVGVNPSMMKLDIAPNTSATTVFLAGDATVTDHDDIPLAGWGQMLPILFKPGEVAVANQSVPASTDELKAQQLAEIEKTIKPGDWILVQFGANEMVGTALDADKWKTMLKTYVDEAHKHQANCVLIVPPMTWAAGGGGFNIDNSAAIAQWINAVAKEQNVPVIDLATTTSGLLDAINAADRDKVFEEDPAHPLVAGQPMPNRFRYLSAYGAFELAKLVAQGIQNQKLDLASHLVGDVTSNPDPAKFPAHLGYDYLLNTSARSASAQ
ncbi:MAG: GDSL-type esterase/lipase family protein [Tepidisphaeraceae bacterium]